jgi:hypothetical protein
MVDSLGFGLSLQLGVGLFFLEPFSLCLCLGSIETRYLVMYVCHLNEKYSCGKK